MGGVVGGKGRKGRSVQDSRTAEDENWAVRFFCAVPYGRRRIKLLIHAFPSLIAGDTKNQEEVPFTPIHTAKRGNRV